MPRGEVAVTGSGGGGVGGGQDRERDRGQEECERGGGLVEHGREERELQQDEGVSDRRDRRTVEARTDWTEGACERWIEQVAGV